MTHHEMVLTPETKVEPRRAPPRDRDLAAVALLDREAMPPVQSVFNLLMRDIDETDSLGLALGLVYHAQMIARSGAQPLMPLSAGGALSLLGMAYAQESARVGHGASIAALLQEWWDERARARSDATLLKTLAKLDSVAAVTPAQWQQALFLSEGALRQVPAAIRARIYEMQAVIISLLYKGNVANVTNKQSDTPAEEARAMREYRDARGAHAMAALARHPHVRWDPDTSIFLRQCTWQGM